MSKAGAHLIQEAKNIIIRKALDTIIRLTTERNLARTEVEELQQNCDRERRKADLFCADLAERDATIELVRALVEDPHAALVVDRIRAALEEPS